YKEESEPLGQRIEPVDPSPGYPNEYSEITDIASQPEWNCAIMKEFSGGFFNMPVECQKKEAEMMDFSIAGALRSMEPENPQRIAADHEAGHKGHGKGTPPTLKPPENLTPEEIARRRDLAATGIFDNEGEGLPSLTTDFSRSYDDDLDSLLTGLFKIANPIITKRQMVTDPNWLMPDPYQSDCETNVLNKLPTGFDLQDFLSYLEINGSDFINGVGSEINANSVWGRNTSPHANAFASTETVGSYFAAH